MCAALNLSAKSGTLKYLNLSYNHIEVQPMDQYEGLIDLVNNAKNLQVLRMHKAFKLGHFLSSKGESDIQQQFMQTKRLVEALC